MLKVPRQSNTNCNLIPTCTNLQDVNYNTKSCLSFHGAQYQFCWRDGIWESEYYYKKYISYDL